MTHLINDAYLDCHLSLVKNSRTFNQVNWLKLVMIDQLLSHRFELRSTNYALAFWLLRRTH